jgi:hypothetical protein
MIQLLGVKRNCRLDIVVLQRTLLFTKFQSSNYRMRAGK